MQLCLISRKHGADTYGVLNRLGDDNLAFREGRLTATELRMRAEIAQVRWLTTCPHLFEDIRIHALAADLPNNLYPSTETRYLSKAQMSRQAQKRRESAKKGNASQKVEKQSGPKRKVSLAPSA
jgi:hypothetical protein